MSENVPVINGKFIEGTDITEQEMEQLQKFIADGMPGYTKLDDVATKRITALYLEGKTYSQIARAMRMTKELIIFTSDKYGLYLSKQLQLNELKDAIGAQVEQAKLQGKQTIVNIALANQNFINEKLEQYARTGNEAFYLAVDKIEIEKLLKLQDALIKPMQAQEKLPPVSPIGLNVGAGVSVTPGQNGGVDITPKTGISIAEKMRLRNEERRQAEKDAKAQKTSDITVNNDKNEGESNES